MEGKLARMSKWCLQTITEVCIVAQAAVDPEAAARARMRKQERRATGRKRALDEVRRQRSAGLAVKHKRPRGK